MAGDICDVGLPYPPLRAVESERSRKHPGFDRIETERSDAISDIGRQPDIAIELTLLAAVETEKSLGMMTSEREIRVKVEHPLFGRYARIQIDRGPMILHPSFEACVLNQFIASLPYIGSVNIESHESASAVERAVNTTLIEQCYREIDEGCP